MPVGTYNAVKGVLPEELRAVVSQVILANAYHDRWGSRADALARPGPILTDSGGYQVFSLRSLQKIDGVSVKRPVFAAML